MGILFQNEGFKRANWTSTGNVRLRVELRANWTSTGNVRLKCT
jgi:hypothetical protein